MVDERKVPEGYKVTEVGVIPEDWDFVRIGDLGNFSKGAGIRKDQANSGHIPCIRYGELYTKHYDIIRNYYSFISRDIAETSRKLKAGDVLFAGSGETKEEIGKCAAFIDETEVYAGGDIIIFSPVKGISEFYGYLLNAPFSIKQKASKGQGDAIVHISSSNLADIVIPFPNEIEQKAIAEALSDTDSLIQSLEKLINKKKKIKQGAMQQLLTGKKRLPGFSGEWEVKRLGEICSIATGKKDVNEGNPNGEFPFFTCSKKISRSDTFSFDTEALLIAGNGDVGNMHYYIGKFEVYQRTYALYNFVKNPKFIQYYLELNLLKRIKENIIGSTIPYITIDQLLNFAIEIPKNSDEQKGIAQVLSDMDLEIEALEEKLEKYKTIKQGMMQELLTGRIRLI
jgi:type I restriction enzyme S subunit